MKNLVDGIPNDLVRYVIAPLLDPASLSSLAFTNKSFYKLFKRNIIDIEEFSLVCARLGYLSLLEYLVVELHIDPSSQFSLMCPSAAIKAGHIDLFNELNTLKFGLIGNIYKMRNYTYDYERFLDD